MAKDYFWVKEQADGTKRIGLNDEGRDELGEVGFIDVPAVGTTSLLRLKRKKQLPM